jgi:CRISPR-associated protein Cas1
VDAAGLLTEPARRRLIVRLHERLAAPLRFRGRETSLQQVIEHQAHALAADLRGQGRYRPFIAKW